MWTFEDFPIARVNKTYKLHLDQAWLDHVRKSSVRLNFGCSGGIVSSSGLILTNQHCVMSCAQALSIQGVDYVADGFLAARPQNEKRCEGMAIETLDTVTDVTSDVKKAGLGLTGDAFVQAINARSTELELTGCGTDPHWHCQVVNLYQGGQYKLYKFRKYSDVRLVFVPEFQVAFFGGDADNFNFPRYALDVAMVRIYQDGEPVETPEHLRWKAEAPVEGEPLLVSGNPWRTERSLSVQELESQRDIYLPMMLAATEDLHQRLVTYASQGKEQRRIATDPLFDVENGLKALQGMDLALHEPKIYAARRAEEKRLKRAIQGDPWGELRAAQGTNKALFGPYFVLEKGLYHSQLFSYARLLVRAAIEREKPSSDRLPEYADSRLATVENEVLTPMPIERSLEVVYLEFGFSKAREYLAGDTALTQLMLGKTSPEGLARGLVAGTRLDDLGERQRLWDGGLAAIMESDDPMIQYALRIDPAARELRRQYEDKVVGPTRIANAQIAAARFKVHGTGMAPDATWSPRLSVGRVAGWVEGGVKVKPFTDFAGMFGRATGEAPYALPARFQGVRGDVVLNYVTSNDIASGSSGSPAVNAAGEIVGTVFDCNIHGIGAYYAYDSRLSRTVVVSTAAISEALEKVYGGSALLKELNER